MATFLYFSAFISPSQKNLERYRDKNEAGFSYDYCGLSGYFDNKKQFPNNYLLY